MSRLGFYSYGLLSPISIVGVWSFAVTRALAFVQFISKKLNE